MTSSIILPTKFGTVTFSVLLLPVASRMPVTISAMTATTATAIPAARPGRSDRRSKKPSGSRTAVAVSRRGAAAGRMACGTPLCGGACAWRAARCTSRPSTWVSSLSSTTAV